MTSLGNDLKGCRVLIVEDDVRISMLMQESLEEMGCEVAGTAMLFDDAFDMAASQPFDVALLDISLNGELSYPVAEAMLDRNQKFVFVTGHVMETLPAPFQGTPVLHKPFGLRELQNVLRMALSGR
ncbi:MAG: response regulator [Rhodanobacteraceae bacterium]